jgi:hypothetical protein
MQVAIIMNRNGRWAMAGGIPQLRGSYLRTGARCGLPWPDFKALHFQRALGYIALDELAQKPLYQPVVSAS